MNSPAPLPDSSDDVDFDDNPLWPVAIAMACLFALLACLLAAG